MDDGVHERPLAIVNPAAGGGRCGRQFSAMVDRLRDQGVELDVEMTSGPGEATRIARQAREQGRRRFVAVGGDGTSYEIVNGLFPCAEASKRACLGFLPMGTGNSFLRDFTAEGAEYSLPAIVDDRRRSCDVIRLRHREGELHFINLLSIGFVAEVNGLRARRYKAWGEAGYILAVVNAVARLQPESFAMAIDGGPMLEDPVVFASFNNSRFTGGKMMMAPDADPGDGRLDLVRVDPLSRLELLRTFPKIFKGTHVHNRAVHTHTVKTVEFAIEREIDVMVDGEALRVVPERIDVMPGALDVQI